MGYHSESAEPASSFRENDVGLRPLETFEPFRLEGSQAGECRSSWTETHPDFLPFGSGERPVVSDDDTPIGSLPQSSIEMAANDRMAEFLDGFGKTEYGSHGSMVPASCPVWGEDARDCGRPRPTLAPVERLIVRHFGQNEVGMHQDPSPKVPRS